MPADGVRYENGDYDKVSAHSPFFVRFTITKDCEVEMGWFSKLINNIGDNYKSSKNEKLDKDNQLLLSGKYKKDETASLKQEQYRSLDKDWGKQMIDDFSDYYGTDNLKDIKNAYENQMNNKIINKYIRKGCTK